ncbi:MAG TPA: DUF4870 domain-containing protein [Anaerolineae bacterium]|nr:DUF4870 domain-containing protein [Anaerolineae bacterium]
MSAKETNPKDVSASEDVPETQIVVPAETSEDVTDNDRLMAALAYATQVVIPIVIPGIMLLSEENNKRPFQKYHAVQSLGFLVAAVIYEVLATIVFTGFTVITAGCLACVLWVLFLLPAMPAAYYAYQAYQGVYFEIPLLTGFLVQNRWLEAPPA